MKSVGKPESWGREITVPPREERPLSKGRAASLGRWWWWVLVETLRPNYALAPGGPPIPPTELEPSGGAQESVFLTSFPGEQEPVRPWYGTDLLCAQAESG